MPDTPQPEKPGGPDVKYLIVTGGLLMLIIICLSVLWLAERNKRIAAEARLNQSLQRQSGLESALGQMMLSPQGALISLHNVVEKKPVNIDGRTRNALYITPAVGRRLGLEADEVLIVLPPAPTTQKGAERQQ